MNTVQSNSERELTTPEFADLQRVLAQTVRARLSKTGSYFGVVPKRHANGRLLWPAIQVTR